MFLESRCICLSNFTTMNCNVENLPLGWFKISASEKVTNYLSPCEFNLEWISKLSWLKVDKIYPLIFHWHRSLHRGFVLWYSVCKGTPSLWLKTCSTLSTTKEGTKYITRNYLDMSIWSSKLEIIWNCKLVDNS